MKPVILRPGIGDNRPTATLYYGRDTRESLRALPEASIHTVCTSPPYWGLRSYLPSDSENKALEVGLEESPEAFVASLVEVFREIKRVLRPDGTLWVNLGDSYAGGGRAGKNPEYQRRHTSFGKLDYVTASGGMGPPMTVPDGLKPKDLVGIPWRVAFALQADGWYLRSDIIWCLSGGTWLYVRSQKGDMPMMIKDIARLDPKTVQLWNGQKWTRLLGMSKSPRKGDEVELVLRSGERISCSTNHRWPTSRGLLEAKDLLVGDVLGSTRLPDSEPPKDCALDEDAAWFAGLYLAEGSRSGGCIHIAGHTKETTRWGRVHRVAIKFGGSATLSEDGNNQTIRVYGRFLNAIVDEFVSGRTAHDKGMSPVLWRYSNRFLDSFLDGYLSGDGHDDQSNLRWRLGFCRNYNLERDLRTICARLGYTLTLNISHTTYQGRRVPAFRGELRKERSGHPNEKNRNEVLAIRKARCRYVYDLGVEDEPHLFALASGVLTHNSKPSCMPESVMDRPTKAHEYVFLFAHPDSGGKYFYDADAVKEPAKYGEHHAKYSGTYTRHKVEAMQVEGAINGENYQRGMQQAMKNPLQKNKRSVWTVNPKPYKGSHFAVWPPDLVRPMILAGTSAHGVCSKCGAPWTRVLEDNHQPNAYGAGGGPKAEQSEADRLAGGVGRMDGGRRATSGSSFNNNPAKRPPSPQTTGWQPSCDCVDAQIIPATVLDPFSGSATTGMVALQEGRNYIGLDLNPDYLPLAEARVQDMPAPVANEDASVGDIFDLFGGGT